MACIRYENTDGRIPTLMRIVIAAHDAGSHPLHRDCFGFLISRPGGTHEPLSSHRATTKGGSMTEQIRFNNGAAYERFMGVWSRLAGEVFLDWLAPEPKQRWIDVGCGNGAFTELVVDRCAPADVQGVDPSPEQLAFARTRAIAGRAEFHQGNAMALPVPDNSFDVAGMALVIFFVPDPPKGVAEMARVVRPGGTIASYAWDFAGGGFPLAPLLAEMQALGMTTLRPPSVDAASIGNLRTLWSDAGLHDVETREIVVQRSFADFDEFWHVSLLSPSTGAALSAMPADQVAVLRDKVHARLSIDAAGRVTATARANAIKGRLPG
jgi:SAM-dependent methyltransferase